MLSSTDGQHSYIHARDEMTVVHEFRVGAPAVGMALPEVFTFGEDTVAGRGTMVPVRADPTDVASLGSEAWRGAIRATATATGA